MRSTRKLISVLLVLLAGGSGGTARVLAQKPQPAPKDPTATVVVLATGSTIAGAAGSNVQAGYTSGQVGV